MKRTRRKFSSEFKSQVAIEALKERYTLTELAHKFELHPNQIRQWKQEFLERSKSIFEVENSKKGDQPGADVEKLYGKIGRLEMERDFFKKLEQIGSLDMKRQLVEPNSDLSINAQLGLLNLSKGSFYYVPKGEPKDNLQVMRLMDEHILEDPTAGVLTMQDMLAEKGFKAGYERVRRLMRLSGIMPIYPRRHLTVIGRKEICPSVLT